MYQGCSWVAGLVKYESLDIGSALVELGNDAAYDTRSSSIVSVLEELSEDTSTGRIVSTDILQGNRNRLSLRIVPQRLNHFKSTLGNLSGIRDCEGLHSTLMIIQQWTSI